MRNKYAGIKINWKNKKNITIYLLMLYYLFVIFIYAKQNTSEGLPARIAGFSGMGLILTLLFMLEMRPVRDFLDKHSKWINSIFLFIAPVASFLMVEIMVSNFNFEMFEKYSFFNLIWYFTITFFIYAILRNSRLTVIINNFIIYPVAAANYLVYLFRGNPIIPSDLLAWKTGMSVASNYELSFTEGFIIATLIMLMMYVAGSKLGHGEGRPPAVNRLAGLAVYTLFAVAVYTAFFKTDLIETKIRVIDFFAPKYTYCTYGTAFGFVANVEAMETQPPEGYSTEQVEKVLKEAQASSEPVENTQEKPNIIAIMNEAYSDLSMVGDYATSLSYHPYTSTLEENTTRGALYVSVFGGGTSDTEYEFLTGNSMAVMPRNSVPYQQYVTDTTDSLAATLKAQGYYNIAIHPYYPSGYKRDMVYPLLGFDKFLSKEDFQDPQLLRSYISDRESYKKIIEQYEAKGGDSPLFIFNVTMQNHGGYTEERLFDEEDTVRLTQLPGYEKVEQYLSLLRESDKAFETLIDYFSHEKEHTIILLFGDHQPVAYSEFHDELANQAGVSLTDAYRRKYRVPFLLWANYDIEEDDVDEISANYLSSYLLQTAGLKGTAYNNYLMRLHEKIPVINALFYIDKEGVCRRFSEENAYSALIKEYQCVGYNDALDKKGRLKKYFTLIN